MHPLLLAHFACAPAPIGEEERHSPDTAVDSGEVVDTAPDSGDSSAAPDDHDGDGVPVGDDCDDADPSVYPGAPERCDGADQDCDGLIDDACTTSLRGEATVADAQAAFAGPCTDSNWGSFPEALDLDGDGLSEVVNYAFCDGHERVLGVRDPSSGSRALDMAGDSVLALPGWPDGWALIEAADVNRDGRAEALASLTMEDEYMRRLAVQVYREPRWGMTTDDADLTVFLVSDRLYAGGYVGRDDAALIPGSPGVLAYSGSWLGDYDWCDADVVLLPADATGTFGSQQLESLGPFARYDWDCVPSDLTDAGDLNGDGENELFVQLHYSDDLYLGPFPSGEGDRVPDVQLGGESPSDYDYERENIAAVVPADLDGDGRDELLLTGNTVGIRRAGFDDAGMFSVDMDTPLLSTEYAPYARVTPLDANGDGAIDLAVAIDTLDVTSNANGVVYLEYGPFHGARELGSPEGGRIVGEVENEELGYHLTASDFNADGFDDLVVGSTLGDDGLRGTLWTFLGGP